MYQSFYLYQSVGNPRLWSSAKDRFAIDQRILYKRGFAERATSAITLEEVIAAVLEQLDAASKANAVPVGVISMAG